MNNIDMIEEQANMQERLLMKVRKDLIDVRDIKTEHYKDKRIKQIIRYLNSYKETGVI